MKSYFRYGKIRLNEINQFSEKKQGGDTMKKKRMVTALLTTAMVFGAVPTAFAADNITVTVDGQKVSFGDQQPVNINGRVMVPVRAVAEKMGWDVSFEKYSTNDSPVVNGRFQEYNHVSLNKTVKEDKDLDRKYLYFTTITIEKKTIISGSSGHLEEEKALVADPVVKNGRTLLGIRDLANGLNADVQWDGARKEVKLTTKPVEQYPNYDKLLKYIEEYRKAVGEQTDNQKEQQKEQEKIDVTNESSYAEQMLRLVNEERKKAGVAPLELDSTLTKAAQIRAKEIMQVFDHTRPDGNNFRSLLDEMGYSSSYAGENISKGTFEKPESAMMLWMNSKGHRENILNPDYKYLGVGSAFESESNGLFDDTTSSWVQIFSK